MKKKIYFGVLAFVATLVALACPGLVCAENYISTGLVVAPSSQRMTLKPGDSYRGSITISSPSNASSESKYMVYVAPYYVKDSSYEPVFSEHNEHTQIANWITLDNAEGMVMADYQNKVDFTIDVPLDAPSGGQYASIMVQDVTGLGAENKNKDGISISNVMTVGSIIVANIEGVTNRKGEIKVNELPSFLLDNKLEAASIVKNDGNVHADAKYILQVWPLLSDEEICTNEENADGEFIFPGTEKYHVQECKLPMFGIFKAKQTVKIFDETSIVEKTVIVCPIWLLFIIIFVIFALVFYCVARAKARRKAAKKAEKSA